MGGQYADRFEVWYYVDNDDRDRAYLDTKVKVPYISVVDLHLNYGKWKGGDNVKGFTLSKAISNNVTLSLMVLNEARHGTFSDSAALGFHFDF